MRVGGLKLRIRVRVRDDVDGQEGRYSPAAAEDEPGKRDERQWS